MQSDGEEANGAVRRARWPAQSCSGWAGQVPAAFTMPSSCVFTAQLQLLGFMRAR